MESIVVMGLTALFAIAIISINGMATELTTFADNTEDITSFAVANKFLFFDIKEAQQISLVNSKELILYYDEEIINYYFSLDGLVRKNELIFPCGGGWFDVVNAKVTIRTEEPSLILTIEGGKVGLD